MMTRNKKKAGRGFQREDLTSLGKGNKIRSTAPSSDNARKRTEPEKEKAIILDRQDDSENSILHEPPNSPTGVTSKTVQVQSVKVGNIRDYMVNKTSHFETTKKGDSGNQPSTGTRVHTSTDDSSLSLREYHKKFETMRRINRKGGRGFSREEWLKHHETVVRLSANPMTSIEEIDVAHTAGEENTSTGDGGSDMDNEGLSRQTEEVSTQPTEKPPDKDTTVSSGGTKDHLHWDSSQNSSVTSVSGCQDEEMDDFDTHQSATTNLSPHFNDYRIHQHSKGMDTLGETNSSSGSLVPTQGIRHAKTLDGVVIKQEMIDYAISKQGAVPDEMVRVRVRVRVRV